MVVQRSSHGRLSCTPLPAHCSMQEQGQPCSMLCEEGGRGSMDHVSHPVGSMQVQHKGAGAAGTSHAALCTCRAQIGLQSSGLCSMQDAAAATKETPPCCRTSRPRTKIEQGCPYDVRLHTLLLASLFQPTHAPAQTPTHLALPQHAKRRATELKRLQPGRHTSWLQSTLSLLLLQGIVHASHERAQGQRSHACVANCLHAAWHLRACRTGMRGPSCLTRPQQAANRP